MSRKQYLCIVIILLSFSLSTNVFAAKKTAVTTENKIATAPAQEPIILQEKIIPGRYQLFQGKYKSTSVIMGSPYEEKLVEGLFLLDTATGDLLLCEELTYTNSESSNKAIKGFLYKKHCSQFTSEMKALEKQAE